MSERPLLFIGSSSEGLEIARNLEAELDAARVCHVERWNRDVFEASGYTLDSLTRTLARVDYGLLIASPDDVVESRGVSAPAARDNVLLEFGMCLGALGRERTFLLATGEMRLPSDLRGLTRLSYSPPVDGNVQRAVNTAVLQIEKQVKTQGPRPRPGAAGATGDTTARDVLDREIDLICANARAQGWTVKANTDTTLRLRSPKGDPFSLQKGTTAGTRVELRKFASRLRAAGLRVNSAVRRPVESSPL